MKAYLSLRLTILQQSLVERLLEKARRLRLRFSHVRRKVPAALKATRQENFGAFWRCLE